MGFSKSKVLSVFSDLFSDSLFIFNLHVLLTYFNKKAEFTMIFFVSGCGNAQNSYGCYRGGTESTISGLSGSCVSFLCSAGRSLGLPSSKQTPRFRPLQGESWGLLGYDQEETWKWGNELMLSCPWIQNYQSAFTASVGCLQRAQKWKHRLYHLWLKINICVLFW